MLIFVSIIFINSLFASEHDQHEIECGGENTQNHCVQHILEPMDHHDHKSDANESSHDCHCHHSRTACHQVITLVENYELQFNNEKLIKILQKQSFIHPSPYIEGLFRPPRV